MILKEGNMRKLGKFHKFSYIIEELPEKLKKELIEIMVFDDPTNHSEIITARGKNEGVVMIGHTQNVQQAELSEYIKVKSEYWSPTSGLL